MPIEEHRHVGGFILWMDESTILCTSFFFKGFAVFFSLSRLAYLLQLKMRTQVTPNVKSQFKHNLSNGFMLLILYKDITMLQSRE
jgi:hypothetical protein